MGRSKTNTTAKQISNMFSAGSGQQICLHRHRLFAIESIEVPKGCGRGGGRVGGAGAVGTVALCTYDHMRARKGELVPPRIYIISLLLTFQPPKCTN